MRTLVRTLIATGVLALIPCVHTHLAFGDVISINSFQQQANLSSVVSLPSPSMSANNQYSTGSTIEKKEASAVATVEANKATASASQFPVGSVFAHNPSQSLSLNFSGASSGAIENVTATGDRANISDFFQISFYIDQDLPYSLVANVFADGNITPLGQLKDSNMVDAAVVVSLKQNGIPLFEVYNTESTTDLDVSGVLQGQKSYELSAQAVYFVQGIPNNPASGSATYSVNFSVSAVPEPSSLGVLASLGCLFSLRRRRSSRLG